MTTEATRKLEPGELACRWCGQGVPDPGDAGNVLELPGMADPASVARYDERDARNAELGLPPGVRPEPRPIRLAICDDCRELATLAEDVVAGLTRAQAERLGGRGPARHAVGDLVRARALLGFAPWRQPDSMVDVWWPWLESAVHYIRRASVRHWWPDSPSSLAWESLLTAGGAVAVEPWSWAGPDLRRRLTAALSAVETERVTVDEYGDVVRLPPPDAQAGCSWCGLDGVVVGTRVMCRWGGWDLAARQVWRSSRRGWICRECIPDDVVMTGRGWRGALLEAAGVAELVEEAEEKALNAGIRRQVGEGMFVSWRAMPEGWRPWRLAGRQEASAVRFAYLGGVDAVAAVVRERCEGALAKAAKPTVKELAERVAALEAGGGVGS